MGLIGQSVKKVEDTPKATGQAIFTPDIALPGLLTCRVLRSPYAHALVKKVDVTEAQKLPGVFAVLTGADCEKMGARPWGHTSIPDDFPLATRKVRYVGEGVAAVAAVDTYTALDALELIDVTYEPLEPVIDPLKAMEPDAPLVHDELQGKYGVKGNIYMHHKVRAGDVEKGLKEAYTVIKDSFRSAKVSACPIETHGCVASYDAGTQRLTMWSSTQGTHLLRFALANAIGWSQSRIRVIKPHVGGAFGHKIGVHNHEIIAALFAIKTGRPVRHILDRTEEFQTTPSRHPHMTEVEVGFKKDGTITAWKEKKIQDTGAVSSYGPAVMVLSCSVQVGPYTIPAMHIDGHLVYTNKGASGCYRGFGNPQATYFRESILSRAANELGIDPLELRMRNIIKKEDLPYVTCNGLSIKTIAIEDCLKKTAEGINYAKVRAKREPYVGVGISCMLEWSSCRWNPAVDADTGAVVVMMQEDESVTVLTDSCSSGQGHATILAQIVSDQLGVPFDKVTVIEGDSDTTPHGLGTWGSRTATIHGNAAIRACDKIRAELLRIGAHLLEAAPEDLEIAAGKILVKGAPSKFVLLKDVCTYKHYVKPKLPKDMECGAIVGAATYDPPTVLPDPETGIGHFSVNYCNSAHMCVVKVDPETGQWKILDYAIGEDVGKVIHPQIVLGQLQGGWAQGFGMTAGEDLIYDENGTLLNGNYMDYKIPKAGDMPYIAPMNKVYEFETHDPETLLGQKGIGESALTNVAGAIANAIYDATGVQMKQLPITPEKVLLGIRKKPYEKKFY